MNQQIKILFTFKRKFLFLELVQSHFLLSFRNLIIIFLKDLKKKKKSFLQRKKKILVTCATFFNSKNKPIKTSFKKGRRKNRH